MHLNKPVILASASPRRRELLSQLLPSFEVVVSNLDEEPLTVIDPWETAEGLALAKANAVARIHPDAIVIGADTVVALEHEADFEQLAKPRDELDAAEMLKKLSGRSHLVITGLAVLWDGFEHVTSGTTTVTFRQLDFDEIWGYVESGEPMDKAGAYAIQGGASEFLQELNGSLTNVIGLPMELLEDALRRISSQPTL